MNETLVVVVRGLIGFFTLFIFARLLGKQQISQLTFFDYVLGITIGSIAASLTVDLTSRAWPHWVGLFIWTAAVYLIQWTTMKWRKAEKILSGEPVILIMNGKIMERAMRKMRYTVDDLMIQLRHNGIFDLSQVEFAILETSGQFSVLKKSQYLPVTPNDLHLPTVYQGVGTELIYDGVILEHNLRQVNLDHKWLLSKLREKQVRDPGEVFFGYLDTQGNLYVDTYQDRIKIPVHTSDYKGPY